MLTKMNTGLALVIASLLTFADSAMAVAPDYSSLTAAVDWSSVGTALLAVGVAIVGVLVIFKGIKLVTRAVRGA